MSSLWRTRFHRNVSLWEEGERGDGTFGRSDFVFDEASNSYRCPGGKFLKQYRRNFKRQRSGVTKAKTRIYRASQFDCADCANKANCCPGQPMRKVPRSVHEAARNVVRRLEGTPEYQRSRDERKNVEMLFAHLKRIMKLGRLPVLAVPAGVAENDLPVGIQIVGRSYDDTRVFRVAAALERAAPWLDCPERRPPL